MHEIIQAVAAWIAEFASSLGYAGVGIEMALESANVPLPSEVILPFAGYLVWSGRLEFWATVAAALAGSLAGSLLSYLLGYWGGRPLILSVGRYLLLDEAHLARAERWFARHGEVAVCFGRCLPIVRTFISFPAGVGRMNLARFLAYSAIGALPWTVALVWAGVKLGDRWAVLEPLFREVDWLILVAALAVLAWMAHRAARRGRR